MRQVWIGHSMSVSTIACMRALKATLYFFVVVPSIRQSGIKVKKIKKGPASRFPFSCLSTSRTGQNFNHLFAHLNDRGGILNLLNDCCIQL